MQLWEHEHIWIFLTALPVVAFLYASVGHGGASGYLALMVLFEFAPEVMRPTALVLNLFVAGISFYFYWREGYFNDKLFWSFAIGSIPAAFFGGNIQAEAGLYKKILAIFLIVAILRILVPLKKNKSESKQVKIWQGILIGVPIGFFSGLIGIGGGIILTPVLLLLHWANMKQAAAVSALFIWVNSAAALIGIYADGGVLFENHLILVLLAIIGGLTGAYLGSKKLKSKVLRYMLAFVLALASIKLFLAS